MQPPKLKFAPCGSAAEHRGGQQQVLALSSEVGGMLPSAFLKLQATNPNTRQKSPRTAISYYICPVLQEREGIYPASHQTHSRTQSLFLPTTPSSRAGAGKEQLHHPSLPADKPAAGRGRRTWTSLHAHSPGTAEKNKSFLINFRRNVHEWIFWCPKNRKGVTSAVLEAGPSAPGLWQCH